MRINWDLLQLKAGLLCLGIRSNQHSSRIAVLQNPGMATRTGHVGIQLVLESLYVNVPVLLPYTFEGFTEQSPYDLWADGDRWVLRVEGITCQTVEMAQPPSWYTRRTSSGLLMSELFLVEGEQNLMGSIPGSCFFRQTGLPCGYCRFESNLIATPLDYAETVLAAIEENHNITVTLTGGAAREAADNVLRFVPYIRSIADATGGTVPIEVECPPPPVPSLLANLVDAGATSFSINLELFDEHTRNAVCPGKSVIPRDDYFKAWVWIVENVGPFRAASVLIFGLEPAESTRAGIVDMLERRVRPNVLPFKPMTGSFLAGRRPTSPSRYVTLMQELVSDLREACIPRERIGCATCSACSLEADVVGGSL